VPGLRGLNAVPDPAHVAVVGGGITGLATAWYLRSGAWPTRPDVTVLEAGARPGGKIRTETLAGVPVEAGPDTFLARVPWATDLAREVGLADDLVAPATGEAFVWHDGTLKPLPRGTVLGVPVTARALLSAPLLSAKGRVRAALDLVLPRRPSRPGDPSVAEVVGARLGPEVLDRLVEPLVGGIHAGRADALSLRSAARPLASAAERHRSLLLGARAQRGNEGSGPVFLAVVGGMERLVERLAASLEGAELRLATAVRALTADDGRWRVVCDSGPDVVADAVVLTVPAFAAASLLAGVAPAVARELEGIRYASVVTATLGYRPEALSRPLTGSGFLVPRVASESPDGWFRYGPGPLLTACTFSSVKWPALAGSGLALLRASAGRHGDDRAMALDDEDLVTRLHAELARMVGVTAVPVASRVDRWERSFPQYEPGHEARVGRIERALAEHAGLSVAGAAYRGLGIAACIQSAESTAGQVMIHLSHHHRPARDT
jgi:protoporphyrinogen/coproporphyrinogen III oxidase